jgi:error-prone DNA polymerase
VRHEVRVKVGGFVIARQKPGTAKGITFLLLEDEGGTLNVIVPPPLYESCRLIVRTEPLILVEGVLERHEKGGGAINLLAKNVGRLTPDTGIPTANVRELRAVEEPATTAGEDFAVAAPAGVYFGRGRGGEACHGSRSLSGPQRRRPAQTKENSGRVDFGRSRSTCG